MIKLGRVFMCVVFYFSTMVKKASARFFDPDLKNEGLRYMFARPGGLATSDHQVWRTYTRPTVTKK
jgi:hypothetical protein